MHCPVCESLDTRHFLCVDARDYRRCAECAATFLHPSQLPSPSDELAQYQLHRNEAGDPAYRKFLRRLAEPLLDRLPPTRRGLDYGCGPGPALPAMMIEAGHTMSIFDPFFFNNPVVLADTYDFISCTEVVEHFHRPAEEFSRLDRLLAPGGWLAVMTCLQTDDARFANWHYRRDPTHVVFYREITFQRLARHHGWSCAFPDTNVCFMRKPADPDLG